MKITERQMRSPDGALTLLVERSDEGTVTVGFVGGTWHTHLDLLAYWLEVPEQDALDEFVRRLTTNQIPIITSTDGGLTIDPWVSDNMAATLSYFGAAKCQLRSWTGPAESQAGAA